ncbi:hypothetical protein [Occallatibacter riparius]|uniref:Uncharacterized protein n=1 Tax=Occallatibacter riparius TaxID=1002689 RepID=A0A9J7BPK7_9BACT|nr:hypothetical protein [Occallatibacter riparius]UWZ84465.1 hypothetical protein MOP44_00685 [Occallatibacter riparius]
MNAITSALSGLIDYAGLFPPASLDMRTAVRNYLDYRSQKNAWMLAGFIVDLARLGELRETAGEALSGLRLIVLAAPDADFTAIARHRSTGQCIEAVEIKCCEPLRIARTCELLPEEVQCYVEIPIAEGSTSTVDAIAAVGVRAKLRMGGVTADAFPTARQIAERMFLLADRCVAFKATAGLHHPLRSKHRLTYAQDSPSGVMHGFLNVLCAAAALRFGASVEGAVRILEEQDAAAFAITDDEIGVHDFRWTAGQVREVRQFFTSFGSCSFAEPVQDLEALGWL